LDRWPQIRGIVRDVLAWTIAVYIVVRIHPPIDTNDIPALTVAGGFLGLPFVARWPES